MNVYPELLKFENGDAVTKENWEKRREEIVRILAENEYGFLPKKYAKGYAKSIEKCDKTCAGHAKHEKVWLSVTGDKGEYAFPVNLFTHTDGAKHPIILYIDFDENPYSKYCPVESAVNQGYDVAHVYYENITSDDGDFTTGIAGVLTRPDDGTGFSKISLWAWGLSNIIDYLETRKEIDSAHISVLGHSRLGKTALWCSANDPRVFAALSNDSGCAGAALEQFKHEKAETYELIYSKFPFWFCENFEPYAHGKKKPVFDQHMLIAASAPRLVCVHSGSLDLWADPIAEQYCCHVAGEAWRALGLQGFTGSTEPAKIGEKWYDGCVGYYLRDGVHYMSLLDWNENIAFLNKHM